MKNSIYTTWPLLLSVFLLILNDHVFKYYFPGIITGKISDFSGIFLVILVLRDAFPKRALETSVLVVGLFSYWKSPYSQALIEFINTYSLLKLIRTVDYSDLVAFVIIPVAHFVYAKRDRYSLKLNIGKLIKIPAIVLTIIGITGTSQLPYVHKPSPGSIDIVGIIMRIREVTDAHDLICKKCTPLDNEGLYKNDEISLTYRVLEKNKRIEFEITGDVEEEFFGRSSLEEMTDIKKELQSSLRYQLQGMELVIKLENSKHH